MVIGSHINANKNNIKQEKKKRGELRPLVKLIIRVIMDIRPYSSIGPPEKRFEADFDLFFILIYIAEKIISNASK